MTYHDRINLSHLWIVQLCSLRSFNETTSPDLVLVISKVSLRPLSVTRQTEGICSALTLKEVRGDACK